MQAYKALTEKDGQKNDADKSNAKDDSIFPIFDEYIRENVNNGRWSESARKKTKQSNAI